MDSGERTKIERTRRIRHVAVVSVITLVILVLIAVGIYVIAFVILSPMTGGPAVLPPTKLTMVTSRYPLAATTKTRCDWEGKQPGTSGYSGLSNDKLISRLRHHRAISAPKPARQSGRPW
jgi:hypothetical protein